MAFADGELDAARTAQLADMLAKRPDLAESVAIFARTRGLVAESVKARLGEPVPSRLKASAQDMIRQASGLAKVIPLPPKKATARLSPLTNWLAPTAASLIAVISGAAGFWLATNQGGRRVTIRSPAPPTPNWRSPCRHFVPAKRCGCLMQAPRSPWSHPSIAAIRCSAGNSRSPKPRTPTNWPLPATARTNGASI